LANCFLRPLPRRAKTEFSLINLLCQINGYQTLVRYAYTNARALRKLVAKGDPSRLSGRKSLGLMRSAGKDQAPPSVDRR
jgi:hypothetical protein